MSRPICCLLRAGALGTLPAAGSPLFLEAPPDAGFDFVHRNGMSGHFHFHQMMGTGVAFFDYDNDGDLDVYFVQGHDLGADPGARLSDRLQRNELEVRAGAPFPLHQRNPLFGNLGGGRVAEWTARGGEAIAHSEVSRGLVPTAALQRPERPLEVGRRQAVEEAVAG